MSFVFDPAVLHECAREGVDLPVEEAFDAITSALVRHYPKHIDAGPRNWIFNNAGGAMGQLTLLHCSLSEYIIFFGSPIGTEGHSGRYSTEVYDWVFDGEMWCYLEGETHRRTYAPGSEAYLGADRVKGYRIPDHAWMLEYSRGAIPTMLPFGLADTMVSTLDFKTFARTMVGYGKLTVKSLLQGKI
jgi:C-8 sterol isomerase